MLTLIMLNFKNIEHNVSVFIIVVRLWIFSIEKVLTLKIALVLLVKLDLLVFFVLYVIFVL